LFQGTPNVGGGVHTIAPAWQDFSEIDFALVRSRRVSGLFARRTRPLALMVSASQLPYGFTDNDESWSFGGVSWRAG
ncbi:hypothetical protein, partial [Phaeobacter sp. 22II1-1F12B]|uniref:hypothetical protein n=1 Tax=Phaeobacter sp. 22II1-1F12B TaxID=1317111 RepID=UPI001E3130D2